MPAFRGLDDPGRPWRAPGRRSAAVLAAAVGLGLLAAQGCGATKEDVVRLETSSQDQHAQVRQELAALRQSLEGVSSALRQLRADLDAQLDQVQNRVGIVESLMRDNEQMFQRFQRRLQESEQRQRDVQRAAAAADTAGTAVPDTQPGAGRSGEDGEDEGASEDEAGPEDDAGGAGAAAPGTVPSEIDLYNAALNDYQAGRYELSLAAFREYLRLYPDGTSPDNAQFWIGKIHLDQGQHEEAIRELERLLADYPETDKAAQTTFYLGNANRALGNEERARAYYRDVIERYPASQESQLARRELDR